MGNKAIVCFGLCDDIKTTSVLYFHWNGGPESVYALLDVAREKDMLTLTGVACLARLVWPNSTTAYIDSGFDSEKAMAQCGQDNGVYFITYGISYPRRLVERHPHGVQHLEFQEVLHEAREARKHPGYLSVVAFLRAALEATEGVRYAFEEMCVAA